MGSTSLFINDGNSGDNRTKFIGTGREMLKVSCVSIDEYVREQPDIERMDLLKIDVQGAEMDVLMGAITSIRRFEPMLYIEWDPDLHKFDSSFSDRFFDFGKSLGWKYCIIEDNQLREINLASDPESFKGNLIIPGGHLP